MVIIYLHGFRSAANSGKTLLLKNMFPKHQVIGPDYCPHKPKMAEIALRTLINSLDHKDDILIIGTSLGGYWARWMASEFGVKAITINPSLNPGKSLSTGSFERYDETKTIIQVDEGDLAVFEKYQVGETSARVMQCFVWVALDDEILDAQKTIEAFEGVHPITAFEYGSHRFTQFADMKPQIKEIIALS